jgi:hypothetical protein
MNKSYVKAAAGLQHGIKKLRQHSRQSSPDQDQQGKCRSKNKSQSVTQG